jgi:hypothetical protein
MLIVLFTIILGINLFLSIREKTFNLVILLTNFLLFLLISGSRDDLDLKSYLIIFDMSDNVDGGYQFLFYSLTKLFHYLNFSFYEFRGIIVAICLFCMYTFFKKISLNIHLMYSFYMLYLLFLDYIQFRNFFGAGLFYIALVILVLQKKHWRLWFSICVICSALIHSSFWAYLIFLLIPSKKWENAKMIKTVALTAFIFSIVSVFFRNSLFFASDIISIIDAEKSIRYAELSTNFGGLYFIFLHLFSTCTIGLFAWQYDKNAETKYVFSVGGELINIKKNIRIIFYVDLLSFALCPLVVFSITFYRLLRNLYLLNIVGFSIYGLKNKPIWGFFLLICYLFLWAYVELSGVNFNRLVMPLFETNIYL